MFFPVIDAAFVMVLLTTISWVMRVAYYFFLPQFGHSLRWKLHREEIVIIFIIFLQFYLEQAGVALKPQTREETFSIIPNEYILS